MSKNVNIDIKKVKTTFIDGKTTEELTKEEFQERYGKIKPGLQDKNTGGNDDEDRGDKEEKGTEEVDEKNS